MGASSIGATAGLWAALASAFLWSITITIFTFASRRLGAQVVNGSRLLLATTLLMLLHRVFLGSFWPEGLGGPRTGWLLLSGVVGFALADGCGLESFVRIGPRLGMLVQTLTPVFSAFLAWLLLAQRLSWPRMGAVALALSGIALVVTGGHDEAHHGPRAGRWIGLLFALGAAVGQAVGQFTSLKGMAGGVGAFSATVVRIAAGTAGSLLFLGLRGQLRGIGGAWKDLGGAAQMLGGTLLGSVLGVPLSLYALSHAPVGVAATLMFLVPVFLLPLSRIFFHEPITPRALAGTLLTVGGASGLFLLR